MPVEVRKTLLHIGNTLIEGGKPVDLPLKMVAAVATTTNPWAERKWAGRGWAERGFVADLRPEIYHCAPGLGKILTGMILEAAGSSADKVEGYGKNAIVGLNGEIEHGSALIHTLRFGNFYREAVKAKSYLAFTNTCGLANASLHISLMDKNDGGMDKNDGGWIKMTGRWIKMMGGVPITA